MEQLRQLNEAVKRVIEIASEINDGVDLEVFAKAPLVIHQKFCSELVRTMQEQPNKSPSEVPKAIEILTAISILEECYPKLIKAIV